MSNQEITGNSSFEGEAVMPENGSSSEESGSTDSTDSTLFSSVTSDSSTEEEKVPEPPNGIAISTQTKPPPFFGVCYIDLTI